MLPAVRRHKPAVLVAEQGQQGNVKKALGVSAPALADPCSVEWTDAALTILFKFTFPDTQPAAFSTGRPPRMKPGWGLPAQGLQRSVQLLRLPLPHSHHPPGH